MSRAGAVCPEETAGPVAMGQDRHGDQIPREWEG